MPNIRGRPRRKSKPKRYYQCSIYWRSIEVWVTLEAPGKWGRVHFNIMTVNMTIMLPDGERDHRFSCHQTEINKAGGPGPYVQQHLEEMLESATAGA